MGSRRFSFGEDAVLPPAGSSLGFALGFLATLVVVAYLLITTLR